MKLAGSNLTYSWRGLQYGAGEPWCPGVSSCGASLHSPCWVGRAREMAVLEAALAAACGGQGQLVFLEGEPGIGKTRTLQELTASAGNHDVQVLWGRCYEGEGAPPFLAMDPDST